MFKDILSSVYLVCLRLIFDIEYPFLLVIDEMYIEHNKAKREIEDAQLYKFREQCTI